MTYAAELAKEIAYRMEGRKDALRQTQDGGVKVTFNIHPQDMHPALYGDPMGQRYVIVCVPIDDNEQPKQNEAVPAPLLASTPSTLPSCKVDTDSKRTWDQLSYAQRAGIRSNDTEFWTFCGVETATVAADYIRQRCCVKSRSEIEPGTEAEHYFLELEKEFDDWKFMRGRQWE